MLEVPDELLEERARRGLDRFDELWDEVLHMVPPPSFLHQTLANKLHAFLAPRLLPRGIEVYGETGVFRPESRGRDYRIPDLAFFRPDQPGLVTERGLEGAPLVVLEIRSPDDETYEKFEFWAALGVPEVVTIEPATRGIELFRLAGERFVATSADEQGRLHVATVGVRLSTSAGPRLRVEVDGASVEI